MIETKVEGSVVAVDQAAQFLMSTLKSAADSAGDHTVAARRALDSAWSGDAAEAYRGVVNKLVRAAAEEADLATDAGRIFDEYAGRLERFQNRMAGRRSQATDGGLTVSGTLIEAPADAVPPADLPTGATQAEAKAWDNENLAFVTQKAKADLYNKIADEVTEDWGRFRDWIDHDLKEEAEKLGQTTLAELVADAMKLSPAAAIGLAVDVNARSLESYAKSSEESAAALRKRAADARRMARSGNPAKRAAARDVDEGGDRAAARALDEGAEGTGRLARKIPVIGYAISAGLDSYDIAHGESPGKVVASEGFGLAGAALGGAAVVAVVGVGAPVLAVAAGGAIVGMGASLGAEYAWDHWVPDGAKEAIDDGLKDFGTSVKDAASDVGHDVTHAAEKLKFW